MGDTNLQSKLANPEVIYPPDWLAEQVKFIRKALDAYGRKTLSPQPSFGPQGVPSGLIPTGLPKLYQTRVTSAVANVDFNNLTGYSSYLIDLKYVYPATNNAVWYSRFSTDNGASFLASGNYHWQLTEGTSSGTANAAAGTSVNQVQFTDQVNNASLPINGMYVLHPGDASNLANIYWMNSAIRGDGVIFNIFGAGWATGASTMNALRFLFSSGNIASGIFTVYGLQN